MDLSHSWKLENRARPAYTDSSDYPLCDVSHLHICIASLCSAAEPFAEPHRPGHHAAARAADAASSAYSLASKGVRGASFASWRLRGAHILLWYVEAGKGDRPFVWTIDGLFWSGRCLVPTSIVACKAAMRIKSRISRDHLSGFFCADVDARASPGMLMIDRQWGLGTRTPISGPLEAHLIAR